MNKKIIIIIGVLVLAALGVGWYFKDALVKTYTTSLQELKKADFGSIVEEFKKEIFAPPPLRIGGNENSAVFLKSKVIAETNIQRFDNGNLPPLVENAKLSAAAKAKAQDMFDKQYFEHVSSSGVGPADLVKQYGYEYIVVGENLILGNFASEKEIVQLWMDSPGHRANILNTRYTEIGVAMVKGTYEGRTVWIGVQEFGLPLASCPAPSETLKSQIEAGKADLDARAAAIEAKKQEIDSTNKNSSRYNQLVEEYNAMAKEYNAKVVVVKDLIAQYNSQINAFNQCVGGS